MKIFMVLAFAALFCATLSEGADVATSNVSPNATTEIPTSTTVSPCAGQPDGSFLPDPYDCSKFYECLRGVKIVDECAPGTLWNQDIKTCDFPQNVNCTVITTTESTF